MHASMFRRILLLLVGITASALAATALADPPARVARLSYTTGAVSFSPALDPDNWVQARVNRPFFIGDRLWTDANARAELEFGTGVLHAAPRTSVTILNIDERITQLEVGEGRVNVRVRVLGDGETFEIDTPNLAFAITSPGTYRVEVDPQGDSTVVAVRDGNGEVYGEGRSYLVERGQWFRYYGTNLDNDYARIPAADEFDRWALARDARHDRAVSARYVPRTMIGYEDLDQYGSWSVVAEYGNVWIPRSVPADWAPYRDGHWTWIDPWGWTWVDDAPWGFAPFHYGRWTRVRDHWGWVPGPTDVRPVYAPALVVFVGGNNFSVSVGGTSTRGVAWFPLAPGEVYRPAYQVSREYFTRVNVTNTRVNTTIVTNIYNSPNAVQETRYRYRDPGAVTAVAASAFVDSRPVARATLPAQQIAQVLRSAPVVAAPAFAPSRASVIGATGAARVKPPEAVAQRQAVAKTAPPASPPAFAPTQLNPGGVVVDANPLRDANRARPRERVRVVATTAQPATPAATAEHRGRPEGSPPPAAGAAGAGPAAAANAPGVPGATAPAAAAGSNAPRGGERGRNGGPPRAPAAAAGRATGAGTPAPGTPPAAAAPPTSVAPSAAPAPSGAAPEAKPADQRRDAGARGRDRQRESQPAPGAAPSAPAMAPSGAASPTPVPHGAPEPATAGNAAAGPGAARNNGRSGRGAAQAPANLPPVTPPPAVATPPEPPAVAPGPRPEARQRGNAPGRAAEPVKAAPAAPPVALPPPEARPPVPPARPGAGEQRAARPVAAPPAIPATPAAPPAPRPAPAKAPPPSPPPPAAAPAPGAPVAPAAGAERGRGQGAAAEKGKEKDKDKEKDKGKGD